MISLAGMTLLLSIDTHEQYTASMALRQRKGGREEVRYAEAFVEGAGRVAL